MPAVGVVSPFFLAEASPAVDSPFASGVWDLESGDLTAAVEAACEECGDLTAHVIAPNYPPPPLLPEDIGSTAHGLVQKIRSISFVDGFYDRRTLYDTDIYTRYSPLGPLTTAVERAVIRTLERGTRGPAPVLVIGGGQRLVEAQLKAIFQDQIKIHEVSPKHGSLNGAVDVEFPPSGIDEVSPPKDHFELAYSFFGNIYGKDQVLILQKVIDSLRVGGEGFLMWKRGIVSDRKVGLIQRHNRVFQDAGLDISVDSSDFDGMATSRDRVHTVWFRKRQADVDVSSTFKLASGIDGISDRSSQYAPTIRLSLNGPYFYAEDLPPGHLATIVDAMIPSAASAMGLTPQELEGRLLRDDPSQNTAGQVSALAAYIVHNYYTAEKSYGNPPQLEYNVPLSILVTDFLHNALGVKYTMEARKKAFILMHVAIARH